MLYWTLNSMPVCFNLSYMGRNQLRFFCPNTSFIECIVDILYGDVLNAEFPDFFFSINSRVVKLA